MAAAIVATIKHFLKEIFGVEQTDYQSNFFAASMRTQNTECLSIIRTVGGKRLGYQGFPSVWSDFHRSLDCIVLGFPRAILRNIRSGKNKLSFVQESMIMLSIFQSVSIGYKGTFRPYQYS